MEIERLPRTAEYKPIPRITQLLIITLLNFLDFTPSNGLGFINIL